MKICAAVLLSAFVLALMPLGSTFAVGEGASFYISDYADRYAAYAKKHPEKDADSVLMEVNLHLDEKNYQNVVEVYDPESLTALINKHYALPKKYKPANLVKVDEEYAVKGVTLRQDCYDAFLLMEADMEKEGLSLYIKSGYRKNPKRGGADSLQYAWPGHSEHQTGLAFDLCKKGVNYKQLSDYNMQETDEYEWLKDNAHRYGFILSFPPGKSDITNFGYEPWHWRYVGADTACKMKRLDIDTLAEYWAKYLCKAELAKGKLKAVEEAETTPTITPKLGATPKPGTTPSATPKAAPTPTASATKKPKATPKATPKPTKRPVKTPVVGPVAG